jgi:hypothetical protein
MSLTDTASAMDAHHGAALVERVIAAVGADPRRPVLNHNLGFAFPPQGAGPWVHGELNPMPEELLAAAEFPSGRPLSPSLRRWLAFDTSLLRHFGWLDAGYGFTPWTLGRLTRSRYGDEWGAFFEEASMGTRFDECFLLPGGADSCRVLVTGATLPRLVSSRARSARCRGLPRWTGAPSMSASIGPRTRTESMMCQCTRSKRAPVRPPRLLQQVYDTPNCHHASSYSRPSK